MLAPSPQKLVCLVALCLLCTTTVFAQWSTSALSQARIKPAAVSHGSKAYFAGGELAGTVGSSRIDIFDGTTWTTDELSVARFGVAGASVGNKVIFAGGHTGSVPSDRVDILNTTNGQWSTATLSQARFDIAATTIGTKVIFAGGQAPAFSNVIDIYDDSDGSWTTATMSEVKTPNGGGTIGIHAYFPGGRTPTGRSKVVEVYNSTTGAWSTIMMGTARSFASVVVVDDKLIVAGGVDGVDTDIVDIYDAGSNLWYVRYMNRPRSSMAAVSTGTKAFFVGGMHGLPSDEVDVFELDGNFGVFGVSKISEGVARSAAAVVGDKVLFAGGQTSTHSALVNIYNTSCTGPTVGIVGGGNEIVLCNGDAPKEVTFTGAASYRVSPQSGIPLSGSTATFITPQLQQPIRKYSVTGTTAGCFTIFPLDVSVGVSGCPTITSISPTTASRGETVTITGTNFKAGGPSGNEAFMGSFNTPILSSTTTQFVITVPNNAVTDFVGYRIVGSTYTAYSPIKLNILCQGPGLGGNTNVTRCAGSPPTALNVSGALTYSWAPATGLSATTGSTVQASPTSNTTYTVTGTHADGCTSTLQINVTVSSSCPTITSFSPTTGAPGTSVTITGTNFLTGNPSGHSVLFGAQPATITSATATQLVVVVPQNATTNFITYKITGPIPAAVSAQQFTLPCQATPVSGIPSLIGLCKGQSQTLTASGATTYTWSPSTGLSSTTGSTVTASPLVTTQYMLTGSNGPGCTSVTFFTIEVAECPAVCEGEPLYGLPSSVNLCAGSYTTFDVRGAFTYRWTPETGLSDAGSGFVTAFPTVSTTYTVTGTDQFGCTSFKQVTINVDDCDAQCNGPELLGPPSVIGLCLGQSAPLSVNGSDTYVWSPAYGLSATIGDEVTANPQVTTTYTITGTDAGGCVSNMHFTILVTDCPRTIYGTSPLSGAVGSQVTINGHKLPLIVQDYQVTFNGVIGTVISAAPDKIVVVVPVGATTGEIVVKHGGQQIGTTSFNVCTLPNFTVNTPPPICAPNAAQLEALGPYSYTWSPAATLNSSTGSVVLAGPSATTTYTVTAMDGFGCTSSKTVTVSVLPQGTAVNVSANRSICQGSSTSLQASGANSYTWSPSAGLSATTGSSVTASPSQTTTYTVYGANCVGKASVTVTVNTCQLTATLLPVTTPTTGIAEMKVGISGGALGTKTVRLFHRGLRSTDFVQEPPVFITQSEYSKSVNVTWLDEVGMEYFFTVTDNAGTMVQTESGFRQLANATGSVPNLKVGTGQRDYRIFSVPRVLQDPNIETVFKDVLTKFNGINESKWRLVHYENGVNKNYPDFTTIEPGKGYWFLSVLPATLAASGYPILSTREEPYQLKLEPGWNQIGSPFLFDVSWNDVLKYNVNHGVGALFVFDPDNNALKQSDNLKSWSGGFVNASRAVSLNVPPNLIAPSGRTARDQQHFQLDDPDWFLPLEVEHGDTQIDFSGIGMNQLASINRDLFDESTLPRMGNFVELSFSHPEYFQPAFMRDVVPTAEQHAWTFSVESNQAPGTAILSWDADRLAANQAVIYLFDPVAGVLVEMKKAANYAFRLNGKQQLQILFARDEKKLIAPGLAVGRAYPNPASEQLSIPVIPSRADASITTSVYDMQGRLAKSFTVSAVKGFREVTWDLTDNNGNHVSNGLYIVRISGGVTTNTVKVVVNKSRP